MADIRNDYRAPAHSAHPLESDMAHLHPLVSWRSIVAGLLTTLLCLGTLLALGMAIGGVSLDDGADAQTAGIMTGVWFLVASIISLFAGSYFAARIAKFHTNRIGSAQGIVIAALFFGLFLWQTFAAIGWAGRAASNTVGSASSGAARIIGQAAGNDTVNTVIEDAIGDLNLRADPQVVATGVASRLLRGNTESAKNYLARQAGITPAEADQRIAQLRTQADQAVVQARETAASALQGAGWSLFATLLLGTAAAIGGGALGSRANFRKPLTREQVDAVTDFRTAPV